MQNLHEVEKEKAFGAPQLETGDMGKLREHDLKAKHLYSRLGDHILLSVLGPQLEITEVGSYLTQLFIVLSSLM